MSEKLPPDLERLLERIDVPKGIRQDADDVIRSAVASSPYLQKRLREQVKDGELERISIGDREGTWGFFNDGGKNANIDVDLFKDFKDADRRALEDAVTYVLGHETGHSNIGAEREGARTALSKSMERAYFAPDREGNTVDITSRIKSYIDFRGTDETRSEIEGWNALASRVENEKGAPATSQEVLNRARRFSSFVGLNDDGQAIPLNGVTFKTEPYLYYLSPPDFKDVSPNAQAVSGVAYTPALQAKFGAYAISVAQGWSESYKGPEPYETGINFKELGFTPKMVEDAGLNLGGKDKTFAVTDISNGNRNWITLKQTKTDKIDDPHLDVVRAPQVAPSDPGRPIFDQALLALNNSTTLREGSLTEAEKERVAMGLAQSALKHDPPLTRIDHVAIGNKGENPNIFAVQGELNDPAHIQAHIPMNVALQSNTNMTQGMDQLNQLTIQRQQELVEQQKIEQEQAQQQQSKPPLTMGGP